MTSRTLVGWLGALPTLAALALVIPLVHAQSRVKRSKIKQPNAHMTVTYLQNGLPLKVWSKPVFWDGKVPIFFSGTVTGQRVKWVGKPPDKDSIRLDTTALGQGGHPLKRTFPPGTSEIEILIERPGKQAGSGTLVSQTAPSKPESRRQSRPQKIGRYKPSSVAVRRQRVPSLSRTHSRSARRTKSTTRRTAKTSTAPSVKNKKHSDKPASIGDGRDESERAKKQRIVGTGVLKGKREGMREGKFGGATAQQGGMVSPSANARGKGRVAHGMKGGTGAGQGLPSGGAIWPVIVVPASLRTITSTLLILKDVNAGQLATKLMSTIAAKTTIYNLRKRVKRDARDFARARLEPTRSRSTRLCGTCPTNSA